MTEELKVEIKKAHDAGMQMKHLCYKYKIPRHEMRDILGINPINDSRFRYDITPEMVFQALADADWSRREAAKALNCSVSLLEDRIKEGRELHGLEFPQNFDDQLRSARSKRLLAPGEWCEYAPEQKEVECTATVLWVDGGMAEVRVLGTKRRITVGISKLSWVPRRSQINRAMEEIKAKWPEDEFYRRAGINPPDCEIVEWQTGDMSVDCVW